MGEAPLYKRGAEYFGTRRYVVMSLMIGIVFFSPPLFFIERYSLLAINKLVLIALIAVLFITLVRKLVVPSSAIQLAYLIFAQAALLLCLPFVHQEFGYAFDGGYFNLSIQILFGLLLFLIFASSTYTAIFAKFWVHLHLVMGACGMLVFIAGLVWNLEPRTTFSDRPYYDFGLAYTNVFYQVGGLKLIRIAGFYDEPGTFAFNITFALIVGRIYAMEIWKERLLILFGLTSLSMAFIAIAAFWVILTLDRRYFVYIAIVAGSMLFIYKHVSVEVQEAVSAVTIDRFSIARAGGRLLKGDNRTAIMKDNYRAFRDSPLIGHGVHYEKYVGDVYRSGFIGNPIGPLAINGIVGSLVANAHVFCFYVVLYMSNALRFRDKWLVALASLAILAQKPVTINGLGYLLFVIMTYRLLENRELQIGSRRFVGKTVGE